MLRFCSTSRLVLSPGRPKKVIVRRSCWLPPSPILLVLTQDGRIAKQLIGENSGMDKEYLVRVEGRLSVEGLAKLNFGLSLDGAALKRAEVGWQNKEQLRFILREGKKRQIRRMCEMVGLKVTGLKRVSIGKVKLGELPIGQWRYLRNDERF